jgi:hypothetical protein
MTMPNWLRIASNVTWALVAVTAFGWLGVVAIEYLAGICRGFEQCSGRASGLHNAFWLFFALGILLEGTERLMRWRRGRDQ